MRVYYFISTLFYSELKNSLIFRRFLKINAVGSKCGYSCICNNLLSKLAQVVMILTCILKVAWFESRPGHRLFVRIFVVFLCTSRKIQYITLKLTTTLSSIFFPIHNSTSFYHLTLYNMSY
jgi:hypothetical protein